MVIITGVKYLAITLIILFTSGCSESPASKPAPSSPIVQAKPADENAVIRILDEANQAQAAYMKRHRRYALTYEELIESHFMQQEPVPDATGYEIKLRPAADAGSYRIVAAPTNPSPQNRYFFTDKTGIIRAEQGKEANADSPQISK